jgi:hypothetical protein
MDADTFTKQAEKVLTNVVCQKADDSCFLGQERSADGGIHAARDHSNVRSVQRNTKELCRAIQNKRRGMLTYGVVFLHDSAGPHTSSDTRTRATAGAFQLEII